MCGNILPCSAPCNDPFDQTNQFLWLKLLHTSYISPLNKAEKGRVFYSFNKYFETGADLCNFCDKQILKNLVTMFVSILLRDHGRYPLESSRHHTICEFSLCMVKKRIGSHLKVGQGKRDSHNSSLS